MILSAIGGILLAVLFYKVPVDSEAFSPASESSELSYSFAEAPSTQALSALSKLDEPIASSKANRYRLAGTFLQLSSTAGNEKRLAILDDLQSNQQYLLKEGDREGELEVVKVEQNQVELLINGIRNVLALSFQQQAPATTESVVEKEEKKIATFVDMPALEVTAFGKQVATNQWVFKREALLGYYNKMMDNPERLANLYMSFRPDYKDNDKIGGYQLDMQGEEDFLAEVGMLQGDVVRKVNSLEMTSQRRAEYFIGTFARDELNAVVLDIERDGKPQKLIYMIR